MFAGCGEHAPALQKHGNFCRVPAETIETCAVFRPVAKILPTKTAPVLGSRNGHQNACVRPRFWVCFWTPKRGPFFVGEIFAAGPKIVKVSIVLRARDKGFAHRWVFHGFAPRALVLHILQTFMSTHVLEMPGSPDIVTMKGRAGLSTHVFCLSGSAHACLLLASGQPSVIPQAKDMMTVCIRERALRSLLGFVLHLPLWFAQRRSVPRLLRTHASHSPWARTIRTAGFRRILFALQRRGQ